MNEQLVGHDDGVTEGGVRRLRRPPDWEQDVGSGAVRTIAWLPPDATPAIGDECDIDGMRYRMLDSTWLAKTPHPGMLVHARGRAIQLELDPIGDSPEDPLLPRARAIMERHGGTIEQLGAQREGTWRHATIQAKATWPGRTELKIERNALPALVARMGGEVIITEEELEELGRAYRGYENLAVKVTKRGDAFEFRTIRNPHTIGRGRT